MQFPQQHIHFLENNYLPVREKNIMKSSVIRLSPIEIQRENVGNSLGNSFKIEMHSHMYISNVNIERIFRNKETVFILQMHRDDFYREA